ncbi:MAG: hypothetical protein AVDCRST_MAG43-396, partial [uncultured Thermomicrobiales bacterium]
WLKEPATTSPSSAAIPTLGSSMRSAATLGCHAAAPMSVTAACTEV